mgnify:CR=1 FL=1
MADQLVKAVAQREAALEAANVEVECLKDHQEFLTEQMEATNAECDGFKVHRPSYPNKIE